MASTRVNVLMMVAAVVLAAAMSTEAQQQQQLPSCAQKLIPCVQYLNYTGELAPCCDGLKEVMANEVPCLCQFARDHGLLSDSKVEADDNRSPYDLPQKCGVSDTITCDANGAGRMVATTAISSLLLLAVLLMML